MRYLEIISGLRVTVSQEEQEILDLVKDKLLNSDLDERQQEIARLMVNRSLLIRRKNEKGIYFIINHNDSWR